MQIGYMGTDLILYFHSITSDPSFYGTANRPPVIAFLGRGSGYVVSQYNF